MRLVAAVARPPQARTAEDGKGPAGGATNEPASRAERAERASTLGTRRASGGRSGEATYGRLRGETQPVDSSSDSTSSPTVNDPPKRYPCASVDAVPDKQLVMDGGSGPEGCTRSIDRSACTTEGRRRDTCPWTANGREDPRSSVRTTLRTKRPETDVTLGMSRSLLAQRFPRALVLLAASGH
jgi:hypothetical protein